MEKFLETVRNSTTTFILIVLNAVAFLYCYLQIGTFDSPTWTFGLLELGASFGPYLLDKEWYRIFTHMFMHGNIIHLLVNMYALYSVGSSIEPLIGWKKYLLVYFLTGVSSVLTSTHFGLFSIGVGASGAIFGLFGFTLVTSIFLNKRSNLPITPIVTNFVIFLAVNLAIAESVNADTPAHLGGLAGGLLLGVSTVFLHERLSTIKAEFVLAPALIIAYFLLPRYQVDYYNFFQKILEIEQREQVQMAQNLTDAEYHEYFKSNIEAWDSARIMLDQIAFLPEKLHQDTFRLKHYISLQRLENVFRCVIIERESYIYFDSINWAVDSAGSLMPLDHNLNFTIREADTTRRPPQQKMTRVIYDKDWIEIEDFSDEPAYYRIGYRDSIGRWQGRVTDFYRNGDVQMKGTYTDDRRNGVFIYYSDHHTYESAGRYDKDVPVGKWESFHHNGKLRAEEYYSDGYYLAALWDSMGVQTVKEGVGHETEYYPNGIIKFSGEYRDGRKEGYWYGLHQDGDMLFEENYYHGRLVRGRSRDKEGRTYVYDASSLFPLPEVGNEKFNAYLRAESQKYSSSLDYGASVRISFRVTSTGVLTDFKIERSISPELDMRAIEIVKNGPAWIPAREHGYKNSDGFAFVDVNFGPDKSAF